MKISTYIVFLPVLILGSCQNEDVTKKETKLDYYIDSYTIPGLEFTPQSKVTYEYNQSGKLNKYTIFSYTPAGELVEQRYFLLSYANGMVESIKGYMPTTSDAYVEYSYAYANGNVSIITEKNSSTVNSQAYFAYSGGGTVKVSYVYTNGSAFEYEYNIASGNVLTDKTTRGSQLCSDGQYTFDNKKNPFKDLGYVDYLLTNLSANNKLTERVNYVGCSFPSLIPESYVYEYNESGYPVTVTTVYKPQGTATSSKREFYYK